MQITDFGVSGKIENTIGKAASFVGTVTYMSPERINGNRHSTVADIWSLGLTVLEVRCGYRIGALTYHPRSAHSVTIPTSPPRARLSWASFSSLNVRSVCACALCPPNTHTGVVQGPVPAVPTDRYSPEFRNFVARSYVTARPCSLLSVRWAGSLRTPMKGQTQRR